MNKRLKIISHPRIHLTLIGMNKDGYRLNGGIGFSVSGPCLYMSFSISTKTEMIDKRELALSKTELEKCVTIIENAKSECNMHYSIKCELKGEAFSHRGLGCTTSISMACIEALFLLNEKEYSRFDIAFYSKRGGTSGIGINSYFDGGYIFDLGIKNDNRHLSPSSINITNGIFPLVLRQCELPNWKIGLCIPYYITSKTEIEEIDFFKNNCPIDKRYVEEILYESVYGITSSIIEKDYNTFCRSINKIQQTQWKLLERNVYGSELIDLEQNIRQLGADCVGMSSFGPLLYFMGCNISHIIEKLHQIYPKIACYEVTFNNQGRILEYD